MARLAARDWEAARKLWEADPDMSAADVGKRFGVSRQAVQKKIDALGWTKAPKVAGEAVSEVVATTKSTTFDNQTDDQQDTGQGKKRLTEAQWLEARIEWEDDERKTNGFIAEKYGISVRAVKERITVDRWTRRIHKQLVHVPKPRPPWRPTIFREEFTQMLLDYFKKPAFKLREVDEANGIRGCIEDIYLYPMIEDFAESIGVHPQRLYEWSTKTGRDGKLLHPDFAEAFARAQNIQDIVLIRGGMAGHFSPTFAVLAARNRLGWRTEIEQEKHDDEAYPDRAELDAMYAKVMAAQKERDDAAKNRVIPDIVSSLPTN